VSGEARSASSNRESTPEADDEVRRIAKLEHEAERRERRGAQRVEQSRIDAGGRRRDATDCEIGA
jgi:hypothetical protein